MTIRDYMEPGDKNMLDDIRSEYDYLITQKFELLEQRDTLLRCRRSIVEVTNRIGAITSRLIYLDERVHTLSRIPCLKYKYGVNPKYTRKAKVYFPEDYKKSRVHKKWFVQPESKPPASKRKGKPHKGPYKKRTSAIPFTDLYALKNKIVDTLIGEVIK